MSHDLSLLVPLSRYIHPHPWLPSPIKGEGKEEKGGKGEDFMGACAICKASLYFGEKRGNAWMSENILNVYFDETGDEGFKPGASQWFILSAVTVKQDDDRDIARVIDDIKYRLWGNVTRQPLHWTRLRHEKKRIVIQELQKRDFILFTTALEKKYLVKEKFDSHFDRENRMKFRWAMYFYATKLLVERICKHAERKDAIVNLIFENRSSISYKDLRDYLTFMTDYPGPYSRKPTIPRKMIKSVEPHNKEVKKLLQVADSCSGAIGDALEINKYGDIEDSYILGLSDKFDRYNGRLWGIGLKVFPRSVQQIRNEYSCYEWMVKI